MTHNNNPKLIDLDFLGFNGTIASYLIEHNSGGILIESGPSSTIPTLVQKLKHYNLQPQDITDLFLTHIHLDHAGAAGWFAESGTKIHVHPNGIAHLLNPEKLLSSAERIYGDAMDMLWGEVLPIPQTSINTHQNGETVKINNVSIQVFETLGHSNHHYSFLYDGILFSGDIGGIRLSNQPYVVLPTPPPEFHLESWIKTIDYLKNIKPDSIALTHFGIYPEAMDQLEMVRCQLIELDMWLNNIMTISPSKEEFFDLHSKWIKSGFNSKLLDADMQIRYETVNPIWMSASGIWRYWNKYRQIN
jgi:glyoxylase-like metal-dependent hydrolase (beta-lactamase superfamily II)